MARSAHFTEEHEAFRKSVRLFLEKEVAPHADAWEAERRIPRAIWKRMGELGFLGLPFPEAFGGSGADLFFSIAFLEELPRSRMGGFVAAVTVQEFIVTGAIVRHGTDEQRRRFLAPSIAGSKVGAIAISEPDTGSDVAAIRTSAVRDGEGWRLDGAKTWITNGVDGDFYVVAAKTERDAGAGGISLFAFASDLPGIKTSRLRKMGWHSSDTAEIVFEGVRLPGDALVGRENEGFRYIMETFAFERLAAAATSVGGAALCLEATLPYLRSRHAFGRPLSAFQALRHRLADLFAELEAVRHLVYHAAFLTGKGENAVRESAMAKLLASELAKKTADECLQFHGGYGTVEEYPIERFFRDARFGTIVAGTSEIMREILAKTEIDGVRFETAPEESAPPPEPSPGRQRVSPLTVAIAQPALAPAAPPAPPAPMPPPAPERIDASSAAGILRSLRVRLRPEKSDGFRACLHFRFRGSATPEWTVVVDGPTCAVAEGLVGTADCVVTTTEETYVALETGRESPEAAFLTGRVKVSNVGVMTRFMKLFRRIEAS